MPLAPSRRAAWLAQKIGTAVLILVVGLGAYAFWLGARDSIDFDAQRLERLRALAGLSSVRIWVRLAGCHFPPSWLPDYP
jgi:hypothetical protein